jgi:hypothetical protein
VTISHTTIYRWPWACPERSKRLPPFLRVACKKRRKPYGKPSRPYTTPACRQAGRSVKHPPGRSGRVSIDERPRVVAGPTRLGDWGGRHDGRQGRQRAGGDERKTAPAGTRWHERGTRRPAGRSLRRCTRRCAVCRRTAGERRPSTTGGSSPGTRGSPVCWA